MKLSKNYTQEEEAVNQFCAYMEAHPEEMPAVRRMFRRIFGPDPFGSRGHHHTTESQIEGGL
jgi:hypothetical protein